MQLLRARSAYLSIFGLLAFCLFTAMPVSGATDASEQLCMSRMWVCSIGIHRFQDDHLHPGKQAVVWQDVGLIDALRARGVPDDHIVALRDDQATLANCQQQLQGLITRTKPGDFLLFVLHSHGGQSNGGFIATYERGGSWKFPDLLQQIEDGFAGSQACLCVAACHSGSLLDTISSAPTRIKYYAVTSVHPEVSALTIATADFEACIRDAFDGSPCPDLNGDGQTTFAEFGQYIKTDQVTLFNTRPDAGPIGGFNTNMIIGPAKQRSGPLNCALVQEDGDIRGRVIKQTGNRLLVRGSKKPQLVNWVRRNDVTILSHD